VFEAVDKDSG
jgi:serine/threonine protein kinase